MKRDVKVYEEHEDCRYGEIPTKYVLEFNENGKIVKLQFFLKSNLIKTMRIICYEKETGR